MSVNLPFLLTAVVKSECCRSSCDRLRFNRGAMLAAEGREIQPAADDLQPQHDGFRQLHGEPDIPRQLARDANWFQHLGTGAGNSHLVPGTNRSSRRNRGGQRRQGGASRSGEALAHLSFPYYVVSAGITSMVQSVSSHMGWGLALAVFPVMYVIHRSYRLYFGRMVEALHPQVMSRAASAGA